MNSGTLNDSALGFTISFSADDLASISGNGRTGKANMRQVRSVVGKKIMQIILPVYHKVAPADVEETLRHVEVSRVSLHSSNQKSAGPLVEIIYHFTNRAARGNYRHVFHFVSQSGGLSGKLYTQTRRYTAR